MAVARFYVGDVFEQLAKIPDASIDMVMTSPPFLGLREYLPGDHPLKPFEIGLEATPADFIDTMLELVAVLRSKLAPHGSLVIELGDTYSESGGAGGDYYNADGWRADQPKPRGSSRLQPRTREGRPRFDRPGHVHRTDQASAPMPVGNGGAGWPLSKSKALLPELLRIALAYGINPLSGQPSPAGLWRIRNVITWCRTNPPVGALGDKFRNATSDMVVACTSDDRWWDEVTIRVPASQNTNPRVSKNATKAPVSGKTSAPERGGNWATLNNTPVNEQPTTAPPLDFWVLNAAGYAGAHFAVYPPELCVTPIQAMCPQWVCSDCGEPRRPIVETMNSVGTATARGSWINGSALGSRSRDFLDQNAPGIPEASVKRIIGHTHCACHTENGCRPTVFENRRVPMLDENDQPMLNSKNQPRMKRERVVVDAGWCKGHETNLHDHHRRGVVLDPFGGSGTTGLVATGHGRDAVLIDIDERNVALARERVGPLFFELVE